MPASQVDFLIVGQGLAGSILAFELITRGRCVMVLDNAHMGSASKVAAGIINPITGHRLNLTDGFVDYLSQANTLYANIEASLSTKIISSVDQSRLIKNPGQASYLNKRLQQDDYKEFLEVNSKPNLFGNTEYGTVTIKQTSIVDTKLLLREIKAWLKNQGWYQNSLIDYSKFNFENNKVEYEGITASRVIFCEGYQAINNPWLKNLPFKLAKGEILTIEKPANNYPMLSWGNWLTPHNGTTAKLGSNYAWQDIELSPSKDVSDKLINSLENQTGLEARVVNHEVGIRPTTTHRHAFVGSIKSQKNAYCFNGFGSKGCLTIPAHANLLCDHLLDLSPIPEALDKWL